jgi:hypothetical protein
MSTQPMQRIEAERSNFKVLLVANPNYFGNLIESKFKAVAKFFANTKYEALTCVGFNPAKNLLEATVEIKLSYGYGGNLCGAGTHEYVRFFVDYGTGWEDAGFTGFRVHDIPTGKDCIDKPDKPLMYVATLKYSPKTDCCDTPVIPKVKAILSWQWIPPAGNANANWQPPWGNALESNIQVQPLPWYTLYCLLKSIETSIGKKITIPPLFEQAKYQPLCVPDPPPFTLAEIAKMYTGKAITANVSQKAPEKLLVEPHRFGVSELHAALSMTGFNLETSMTKMADWKALNLDWQSAIAALNETKANVTYEELECLGIDNLTERLVATFRVKRPVGYNGNLCTKGSVEYVAFWADWNDCQWTYLGTSQVSVHDIPKIIKTKGICYSAILPVDLSQVRRSCKNPKTARVRAVLSWNVPPSTVDPDALTYWGNRIDVHIQINPGEVIDPQNPPAKIRNIGGIPVEDIDTSITPNIGGMTLPSAVFAHYPYYSADQWGNRRCPFGGRIIVEGNYLKGLYYRVQVRKQADPVNTLTTLSQDFYVERADIGFDHQVRVNNDGWFKFLDPMEEFDRTLALWDTAGNDLWEVQLDVAPTPSEADPKLKSSGWYRIQLDNTAPTADIHITAGGDCKTYQQGNTINGTFIADDLHFGHWNLQTLPSVVFGISSNQPTASGLANTDAAPAPSGHAWSLNTASPNSMPACGYVIRLDVYDRTIVNSLPHSHNWKPAEVGFCLREIEILKAKLEAKKLS